MTAVNSAFPPEFPDGLPAEWNIGSARLVADTPTSRIYRVTITGADTGTEGRTRILKHLKPDGLREKAGFAFLAWREGSGAVALLAEAGDCCLLEDGGRRTLAEVQRREGDVVATEVLVGLLGRLHAASPLAPPSALVPLERHLQDLFAHAETADGELRDLACWGADLARDLLAKQRDVRPLHGDLHHDNVLQDASGVWRTIDPQGLFGDPAYDVANVFGNPLGAGALILDPDRVLRLAHTFAPVLDRTPRTVLSWAGAHAMLSTAWSLQRPENSGAAENIAERTAFARIVRHLISEQFV